MPDLFADVRASVVCAFHDSRLSDAGAPADAAASAGDPWRWIELDHRCNRLLWDEEDLARRTDVPDREIVANKRAIDRFNQQRNDAIERLDEALLSRLASITPLPDAWHNSETAGSMIDRLSILALKLFHMRAEGRRPDATVDHAARCGERALRLATQRDDLGRCLDTLLSRSCDGRAYWRIYRQFKMYNDPSLNPYLRGRADRR